MALNKDKQRLCRMAKEREKANQKAIQNNDYGRTRHIPPTPTYNDATNYKEIELIKRRLKMEKERIKNPHWQLKVPGFELD